jgi:hypothetical protein
VYNSPATRYVAGAAGNCEAGEPIGVNITCYRDWVESIVEVPSQNIGGAFGKSVAMLRDVDGDNVNDLAVGARFDDDNKGAVYIIFLGADGARKSSQKIQEPNGGGPCFGVSVASVDIDGDGNDELAVGAADDISGNPHSRVWILFLESNGTVKSSLLISLPGTQIPQGTAFGCSLSALTASTTLVVGAWNDDDGGTNKGAVYIIFLQTEEGEGNVVQSFQKISDTKGNFEGVLEDDDQFGANSASLGDLDGDGVEDLAVSVYHGESWYGAVHILFLLENCTVRSSKKISHNEGGFTGALNLGDNFGFSLAVVRDMNDDGVPELALGTWGDNEELGCVWIAFLKSDGTVQAQKKLRFEESGIVRGDHFGNSLASIGNGIAVGADNTQDSTGAVFLLYFEDPATEVM